MPQYCAKTPCWACGHSDNLKSDRLLGAEDTAAPYSISWDTTSAADGAHTLTAVARDTAGNTAESSPVIITVNNTSSALTFTPTDDAAIHAGSPHHNYGSDFKLSVDGSPVEDFLLKFTVSGIGTKRVVSAKLRLYVEDTSSTGGDFYRVTDNAWSEDNVTWLLAPPAIGTPVASVGATTRDTWVEIDVTPVVTGDGTFSLRASTTASDGADYASKEAAAELAPRLVVTVQ
jgi:hypothetical protein